MEGKTQTKPLIVPSLTGPSTEAIVGSWEWEEVKTSIKGLLVVFPHNSSLCAQLKMHLLDHSVSEN